MQNYNEILKQKFNLKSFREWQFEIIESVINGNNTLVFMPTWWWKSLIYQFSWIIREWLVLVISPLISLMKDQVDKLNKLWLRAEMINSTINSTEKSIIFDELSLDTPDESWAIKFLYIAPERLNDEKFLKVIKSLNISLIAIDEAHCISQWWHDFRPSYLKIAWFIKELQKIKKTPIIWLTATATEKVKKDIVEKLWLKSYKEFIKGFDRKNLLFIVREITKEDEKLEKILEIIQKTPPFWIIYCSSIKTVSKVYQYLLESWIRVWIYNWMMRWNIRETEQNNFMNETYDVVVATNAFWMWIDKHNIRYVIHYNLPWSIENYYQEAGRAWRDWKTSYSVILASYQDTIIQEFFIKNTYPPKTDILKLYDYFNSNFDFWEWEWTQILKTYNSIAIESWLKSDMKVWSIIKIFEKYWIIKRWYEGDLDENFRWKWVTLVLNKMSYDNLPIKWEHQDLLKNEWYFKLEQIKKLLFRPWCRKKFILEYFWDSIDLDKLWENCWKCDYCIDRKKFESGESIEVLPHNVFYIILEFVKRFQDKFWIQVLSWVLTWSLEKKILDWNLDLDSNYNILSLYTKDTIVNVFEVLLNFGYLYKNIWKFPTIWITHKWLQSILNNKILLDENLDIQSSLHMKLKQKNIHSKNDTKKIKVEKIDTYTATLELYNQGYDIDHIAKKREMTIQTIQTHIIKLYEFWKINLWDIMKYTSLDKLKKIKETIQKNNLSKERLRPIKDLLDDSISYFDIKIAISLIEKNDL